MRRRGFPRFSLAFVLLVVSSLAQAQYKVSDEAPAPIRAYLEQAIENGKKEHAKVIADAKKDVTSAEARLAEVRKQFRKMKAKEADLKAAEAEVASAKRGLSDVSANPPLALATLKAFDRPGAIGRLGHGFGVSRVVDDRSALVFPFVEKANKDPDGKLFTDNEQLNKETGPTARPLLLLNTDTRAFEAGKQRHADSTVYQVGPTRTIDDETCHTLEPLDLFTYLIKTK